MKSFILFLLIMFLLNLNLAQIQGQTQTPAQAQGQADIIPLVRCKGIDCTFDEFIETLQRLIRAILIISYWIAAVVVLIGSFMIMLGGYQKGWLNTGKKMIVDALVSYVVLLLAGILFDLFLEFLRPRLFGE